VIGHESDIKAWTQADLEHYFRTYYAPNNAVAVVVGDVKAEQVKQLATKYFGAIPKRALPPPVRTVEPPQTGERRLFITKESATAVNLAVAYKCRQSITRTTTRSKCCRPCWPAARPRACTGAGRHPAGHRGQRRRHRRLPGLLYLSAVAAGGVDAGAAGTGAAGRSRQAGQGRRHGGRAAKGEEPEAGQPVPRAGNHQRQGAQLGNYEVFFGSYKKMFDAPAAYQKLTPADIQAVAAKYLTKSQRTIGVLAAKED
jgi:hypothetical protein